MKELKFLKLKDCERLTWWQMIISESFTKGMFWKVYGITSFDKIFQQSTTTTLLPKQNKRSASTYQLRKPDFKTEKYGRFSIISAYQIEIS